MEAIKLLKGVRGKIAHVKRSASPNALRGTLDSAYEAFMQHALTEDERVGQARECLQCIHPLHARLVGTGGVVGGAGAI